MYNPFNLINKTILVTGASSGIGKVLRLNVQEWVQNLFLLAEMSVA